MRDYSEGMLQEALETYRRGIAFISAAKQFSVRQVTLRHRFKNRTKK